MTSKPPPALGACKTKLVCTIGPASESPAILNQMLDAGMSVARLNYAHGDFEHHRTVIEALRGAARSTGRRLTIMADLPGPKLRIGALAPEVLDLRRGDAFSLTTAAIVGTQTRASVNFTRLPDVVHAGDVLLLNDGTIQLQVQDVSNGDVNCRVLLGGELRSGKGLNLPGIALGDSAFTARDHTCLESALRDGVDAISQSFVEVRADVDAVRAAAKTLGHDPFIIAKIERSGALAHIDEIIEAADGIMIARGDLGVEIPLEGIAVVQKQLTAKANLAGKPVITATQMLESMMRSNRPTRAESTDVANAILDGTDCVMLSEESAIGMFPVEAVRMLAKIAAATEPFRVRGRIREVFTDYDRVHEVPLVNLMSHNVQQTVDHLSPAVVMVATATGRTARLISRFKLPVWVAAVSANESACQGLQFSYGVHPVHSAEHPRDWNTFAGRWVREHGLPDGLVVLATGPSSAAPAENHRLEVINLSRTPSAR